MKTHKLLEENFFSEKFIKIICGIWNVPEGSQREKVIEYRYKFKKGHYK